MKRRELNGRAYGWPWRSLLMTLAAASLLLGACDQAQDKPPTSTNNTTTNTTTNNNTTTTGFRLLAVTNCEDIRERFVDAAVEQVLMSRYSGWGGGVDVGLAMDTGGYEGGDEDGPSDFTGTNVQEVDVDEPDIVKTDGSFIYTVHNKSLVILKSWPAAEVEEVGRVEIGASGENEHIETVSVDSLFLRGDRVAIFSRMHEWRSAEGVHGMFDGTRISILDVSNRAAPRLERQLDIEGTMVSARMIDGKVYLVSNSQLRIPFNVWEFNRDEHPGLPDQEWDAGPDRQAELRDAARPTMHALVTEAMSGVDITDTMPRQRIGNEAGEVVTTQSLYDCTDIYLTPQLAERGVLNITSFTLDAETAIDSTGLMASGWLVYASRDNLYVSMTSRSWWGWGDTSGESHIHKFELPTSNEKPRYTASGRVDGWILNQFSMSEYNGYLRVATTDNRRGAGGSDSGGNHMIVLKQDGALLEETGSVRNLAPTERIYSARMMGPKGYMVTFRETDPLYTFDLSDPYNPLMLGELHIEGYSSYMHPLGEHHLLAIGMDGDENGRMSGVHLQVFDVSDMANPTRTHHHVISTGSWSSFSEALSNHHAFTYHAGHGVLAVPMSITEAGEQFTGLMVFKADAQNGFAELGRVSHADLVSRQWCEDRGRSWDCDPGSDWAWWSNMRRSIFMSGDDGEDYVYSLSTVGLKVSELYAPENEIASVGLR